MDKSVGNKIPSRDCYQKGWESEKTKANEGAQHIVENFQNISLSWKMHFSIVLAEEKINNRSETKESLKLKYWLVKEIPKGISSKNVKFKLFRFLAAKYSLWYF